MHAIDGCSVGIGLEEGYGEERMCMKCHHEKEELLDESSVALRHEEVWKKKKSTKKSKYMKPNPSFDIMTMSQKQNIGLLKNGNLALNPVKIGKNAIHFRDTCAFDALAQAFAAIYAYHPSVRPYYDNVEDDVAQIARSLAKK